MNYKHDVPIQPITDSESLPFTWERLIPKQIPNDPASQKLFEIHLRRYETAARYVKGKRVLDIACGTGYGSQMLRRAGAIAVVGVDICPETVQYARKHYQENNVEFVCADALAFEWKEHFDVIVSFETIEHVLHPDKFLDRLRYLLLPEGKLLLSAPLGETRHIDPYHLHAFSQEDVFALLEKAGFLVEQYRCDDWCLTRRDLLLWRQLYPAARPNMREQFLTLRGWQLLRDFCFRGVINVPEFMVAAQAIKNPVVEKRQTPTHLD
ncbi:class I SAM-dependent methyltransferase [Anabaena sp. WFMT]|uniref:class I SAM-dependent methyltransferase n=1 Tax=Anabaena sp. WFMT TaxID=3449730 RepID=UPI003F287F21